nr:ribonuclease H-like domain-containing protein [Tanacetum cinerariifolium]
MSLYGFKQASRAWFQRFTSYITRVGFSHSRRDSSLFIYRQGTDTTYLLLYVDDIVLTASSERFLQQVICSLHKEFAMTDLGPFNYFLGISVTRDSSGMFLSQKKYAIEILDRAHMINCNPSRTPIDTESKLGSDGDPVSDPTLYWSLAGTIQTVLSLAASRHWPIHQLDMSLYGFKQASRAWFQWFTSYITRVGFSHSRRDSSLFIYRQGTDTTYLLLYVDDIVLTASSESLLQQIIRSLHQEFAMTDLVEILNRAHMVNCNPSRTPIDTESKLGSDGDMVADPTLYQSLAGTSYVSYTHHCLLLRLSTVTMMWDVNSSTVDILALTLLCLTKRLYLSSTFSSLIIDDEKIHVLRRLNHDDSSGLELTKEVLPGDNTLIKPGTLENLLTWARNRKMM